MKTRLWAIIMVFTGLAGCQPASIEGTQLRFREVEPGTDPAVSRMQLSKDYLRIDDGAGKTGFILFDRHKSIIYNISVTDRSIMIIAPPRSDLVPPFVLKHTIKDLGPIHDAPKIGNVEPLHRQYLTNGELCMDVIGVDGMLPEMRAVLTDYYHVLATDSATTFTSMPADLQKPCDISTSTFAPARQYQNSFPIREWWPNGYKRVLEEYQDNIEISAEQFVLPRDYFTFTVQQLRDGLVDMQKHVINKE